MSKEPLMPVIKEKTIFFFSFLSDSQTSILLYTYKIDKTMNHVAVDHRIRHTPLEKMKSAFNFL